MGVEAPSPTFAVWVNPPRNFMTIVIEPWMVMPILMTVGFFRFVRTGKFEILAGCMGPNTGLLLASAVHSLWLSGLFLGVDGSVLRNGLGLSTHRRRTAVFVFRDSAGSERSPARMVHENELVDGLSLISALRSR